MSPLEPEDLLLDFALDELLGVKVGVESALTEDEMVARVQSAWEAGERRPAPHRLHLSPEIPRRRLPHFNGAERPYRGGGPEESEPELRRGPRATLARPEASPHRMAQLLGAAALILAVGGAWWWSQRPASAPQGTGGSSSAGQVAAASWRQGAGGTLRTSLGLLDPGDVRSANLQGAFVVAPGAPARLERRALGTIAATLEAAPGSVFAFLESSTVVVAAGEAQLDVGVAPMALELPGGVRISAPPSTSLRVSAISGNLGLYSANPDERVAAARGDWRGILRIEASAGEIRFGAGDVLPLSGGPFPATLVVSGGGVRVATTGDLGAAEDVATFLEEASREKAGDLISESSQGGLIAGLRREPALWPLVAPEFERLFADPGVEAYVRQGLIGSLAVDASPVAHRLLRSAWRLTPGDFTTPTIVSLAEHGVPEFEREVEAWLDFDGPDPFTVAMYLAQRGDDRGESVLREVIEKGDVGTAPILAGAALALLGDVLSWEKAVFDHVEGMRSAMAADLIESAAGMLNVLTYAVHIRRGADPAGLGLRGAPAAALPVGMMQFWVGVLAAQRPGSLVDAESIEAALIRLELP